MTLNNKVSSKFAYSLATAVMVIGIGYAAPQATARAAPVTPGLSAPRAAPTTPAQDDRYRDRDRWIEHREMLRIARDNGFRDGFRTGRDDALNFRRFDPDDNPWYQQADNGYRSEMGDFDFYMQAYRESFIRGYRAGFARRRY